MFFDRYKIHIQAVGDVCLWERYYFPIRIFVKYNIKLRYSKNEILDISKNKTWYLGHAFSKFSKNSPTFTKIICFQDVAIIILVFFEHVGNA